MSYVLESAIEALEAAKPGTQLPELVDSALYEDDELKAE